MEVLVLSYFEEIFDVTSYDSKKQNVSKSKLPNVKTITFIRLQFFRMHCTIQA